MNVAAINQGLDTATQIVIWGNWTGACFALAMNLAAARRHGNSRVATRLFAAIAAYSAVFVAAYLVLLLGPFPLKDWFLVIRIVSLGVWPVVWSSAAYMHLRHRQAESDHVAQLVYDRIMDQ